MKMYLVYDHYYEEAALLGIFTSIEKAEAAIAAQPTDDWTIQEMEVDTAKVEVI